MCMYDVITIGSSMVDFFIHSDEFSVTKSNEGILLCQRYGDKIEVDQFTVETGGGGGNTAVGFSRAGFHTAIVTETGKDVLSQLVAESFHAERVATNLIIQEKREQTGGSVILIGSDGGRTVMVHRGAASELDPKDIPADSIAKTDWVHLSSIAGRQETLETIFKARATGRMSWNPGKQELLLLAESRLALNHLKVDILFLNEQEWAMVDVVQPALLSHIPVVVVTNGGRGGRVLTEGTEMKYESVSTESIDDTGAGDAFVSGFVSGYIWKHSLADCAKLGARNAASVVEHVGSKPGLLRKSELQQVVVHE